MAIRSDGKSKLSPKVRRRLAELAREAQALIYGEAGCPEWGTSFAEMEADAKEVGHEIIRQLLQECGTSQAKAIPPAALTLPSGETAQVIGCRDRSLITESGKVTWPEPQAYLPESRKDFFPSESGSGPGGG